MIVVSIIFCLFVILINSYFYFAGFQSKSYRIKEGVFGMSVLIMIDTIALALSAIISIIFEVVKFSDSVLVCVIATVPSFIAAIVKMLRFPKLRVKFTNRAIRAIVLFAVIPVALLITVFFVDKLLRAMGIISTLSCIMVIISLLITYPFEKRNNEKYLLSAQKKLKESGVFVIAITGSAGKTSVKQMLNVLLSPLGKVYTTPKNYNTPLGVAKAINEMPTDATIFIAEFGARHTGDIDELLRYFKPDVGILTSVLPQHLETFKSLDEIFTEKVKLLENSEVAFANEKCKMVSLNFPNHTQFFGDSILINKKCNTEGSELTLLINNQQLSFSTNLLGGVNVDNLILAIGVAVSLGVKVEELSGLIKSIKQIPHRMERLVTDKGITIIDDSYNINPLGALSAIDLLKTANGRKIVTTSGFVEQGKNTAQATKILVEKIVQDADVMIIVGNKNKNEIIKNINGRIEYHFAKDISECTKVYSEILRSGDTLLIQADIPVSFEL